MKMATVTRTNTDRELTITLSNGEIMGTHRISTFAEVKGWEYKQTTEGTRDGWDPAVRVYHEWTAEDDVVIRELQDIFTDEELAKYFPSA
jgi:hypothetical protein